MRRTAPVATLLFFSGFSALIYQTAWLRQFRLIFGASTFATAAVLAIFLGGLGLGSAILGRRADAHPRPLAFYARLELFIAISAGLSPILLWLVSKIYIALGGSVTLGIFGATIVRLLLSVLVLGVPTVLMGGTLPAAARAVETADDQGRQKLAVLYGTNTLGAVTGTLLSTFLLLETFGNRKTLLMAVMVNLIVAVVARGLATDVPVEPATHDPRPATRPTFVLTAATVVGFAFLLMELVWYRMLAPLLGGSTYTFGLILAIALLGIGLGGAAYSLRGKNSEATPGGFALTCSLEALAIAVPFAIGDRIAIEANILRALGVLGFGGHVTAWTALTLLVVFPAAFVAGIQFPLLIALLGRGREDVGRHVGLAYAWNTIGAIAGSLAGGFGLIPLLSAPGCWRLVIVLLAALGAAAILQAVRERQRGFAFASLACAIAAVTGTVFLGPTAVWRHSGIGAGRAPAFESLQGITEFEWGTRRGVVWDRDGRESSVALTDTDDFAFIINGKADGSARGDAGTQVMSGMVGALLHPRAQRSMVIGLGTGSTAGWLASIPWMQRVDVAELEPAVLGVADACRDVNQHVLRNPKVHIRIADAREVLLTTPAHYDLVFSEPSNPYRAGIASLFTQEFYRAVAQRLNRGGVFLQWVQAYDVDAQTIRTIYATIGSVFPHVQTWTSDVGDLLLLATKEPVDFDMATIRQRVAMEPFRGALHGAWRVESAEGFLAHFLARDTLARAFVQHEPVVNTDDCAPIEFGFARGVGDMSRFDVDDLVRLAVALDADKPDRIRGPVDWNLVALNRASMPYINAVPGVRELAAHHQAARAYDDDNVAGVLPPWRSVPTRAANSAEIVMVGEALAEAGDEMAVRYAEALRPMEPVEADAIESRLRLHQTRLLEATALLERALLRYRTHPWATPGLMQRALESSTSIAAADRTKQLTRRLFEAMAVPFAAGQWNDSRRYYRVILSNVASGCSAETIAALHELEPWPTRRETLLRIRRDCYAAKHDPLAARAAADLADFFGQKPMPLNFGLPQSPRGSSSGHR